MFLFKLRYFQYYFMQKIFIFFLCFSPYFLYAFDVHILPHNLLLKIEKKHGTFAKNRFVAYNNLILQVKDKNVYQKLEAINSFYNRVPFKSDINNWKQKDYWATPLEFLAKDKGDCEDYVIAKMFALKNLGVSSDKLFMTYVRSSRFKAPHMVLTYFKTPSSEPLILDNINFKVLPASKRTDLTPIYNFNGSFLRLASKKGSGKSVKIHQKTHKKWDTLIQAIKRNKI